MCGEYIEIKWYNSEVDILDELNDGSDAVDSIWNQVFGNEFEHGMRNVDQTVEEARIAWDKFITDCVQQARALSDKGRKNQNVKDIKKALELLGKAIHALADSYSPSHSGFQEWNPPYWKIIPVPKTEDFWNYVEQHTDMETFADYETMQDIVNNAIINKFRADLLYIIKE